MVFRFFPKMVLVVLLSPPVVAVEVSFESIKGLIEAKNDQVVGKKKKVEAARMREGVLGRSYLPNISASGGYESFKVGSRILDQQPYYGVEGAVNIYNGGMDRLQEEVQKLNTETKKSEVKIVLAEQLGKARELFWSLVYLKQEKVLLENMVQINEKNLKAAKKRIRSGVATPSDRLEFQLKRLELTREVKNVEAKQKSVSYDFLVYLGYEITEPLKIVGELEHAGEWESDLQHTHKDHAFFTKPSVLKIRELKLKRQQEKWAWIPKVDLYAGWYQFNQREEGHSSESERQESVIGVKVTMNLFDKLSARSEAGALEAEMNAALYLSTFHKKQNEAHIEKEFLELKTLHEQVHDSEKHIAMARKYYEATQSEYARGAKNSPDVLSATERLEEVSRIKNQLIRDFQIARSYVLSKIGK